MTISDLSPDALARLEAKLLADVEVVRRVRALMEEHQGLLGMGSPKPVTAPSAAAAVIPLAPAPPRKSLEEMALECLLELPVEGFVVDDLRRMLRKAGYTPKDTGMKTLMNRLIRQGKVCVHKLKQGRGGSTYRSTIPRSEASVLPENTADSPVSSPAPAVS